MTLSYFVFTELYGGTVREEIAVKFYDHYGKKHKTVFGAILGNISKKADDFVRNQMPGYEETINENEHLYDAVTDRYAVYPPEDDAAAPATAAAVPLSQSKTALEDSGTPYIDVITKHWNRSAVLTDAWRRGTNEQEVTEAELLPGELSAVTFQVGCYTVRSASRVYRVHKPGYSPELEAPASREEVAFFKNVSPVHVGAPAFNGRLLRITNEISARHNANPNNAFTDVCRAAKSTSYKWSEQIGAICSAKEHDLIPDEYASLFVCNTYMGDSFSSSTWYKLDPTGKITKLELHPFDSDIHNARFI